MDKDTQGNVPKVIKGHCPDCGGMRNAYVRAEHVTEGSDGDDGPRWSDTGMVLECCGCSRVFFRRDFWFSNVAPQGYLWVADYEKELELFPAGKLNDRVDTFVHGITYLRGQGSVVEFYRRLQQHARAVEAAEDAQAHGRQSPAPPSNPVLDAYWRSCAMWEERFKRN